MRVDVSPVGGLLDLRQDVVEVLGPLEEAETAGVDVREIQDGQDSLRILDEGEDLVEAADDLLTPARLDAEPRLDLPFLVRIPDRTQVLRDPVHRLLRLELAEHAEVRHDDRSAHRRREHAAPDPALAALPRKAICV